jgi:segregation and condensation protein B
MKRKRRKMSDITNKIEAILFVAGDLIEIKDIANGLEENISEVRKQTAILADEYEKRNAGIKIIWVGDSVQMSSREDYAQAISEVLAPLKVQSLTRSAIETLSVIAYKQPVTRTEVAEIRGVRSDYSINILLQRGLIAEAGKKDALGSPMMFATTELFLREFNLNTLEDLPEISDLEDKESTQEDLEESVEEASESNDIE